MSFFKEERLRDPAWLKRVRDLPCVVTRTAGGNDPAHLRYGLSGGIALKPSDDLVLPLRHDMHMEQHRIGEVAFWQDIMATDSHFMMECIKAYARQLYRENKK